MTRASAARAIQGTTVRDVMRIQMVTVVPEMTVRELAHTLLESGVRAAPVLGPTGNLLGVASEVDVARLTLGEWPACNGADGKGTARATELDGAQSPLDTLRVRDVMSPVGPTVSPDEPVKTLVSRFVRERLKRALVVENGMLLGIVAPIDVLGAIDEIG
ncbi:HPP family protein [Longimicrobium sp.]|uniref:CBS domain-containing protein n=1 Tax=Longimicrobium sp. TaxID=2029185 RepID=UPI003B3B8089